MPLYWPVGDRPYSDIAKDPPLPYETLEPSPVPSPMRKILPALLVVGIGVGLWLWLGGEPDPLVGRPAPGFSLPEVGQPDRHWDLGLHRGRTIALAFWSESDPDADGMLIFWQRMHERYGTRRLVVLGVVVEGGNDAVTERRDRLGLTFPQLRAGEAVKDEYRIQRTPVAILVDAEGHIVTEYREWNRALAGQLADTLRRKLGGTPQTRPATSQAVLTSQPEP